MKQLLHCVVILLLPLAGFSQKILTPEVLWQLGRVNASGMSGDKQYIIYSVSTPDVAANKSSTKTYKIAVAGGNAEVITGADSLLPNNHISVDGKYMITDSAVKLINVYGSDFYPKLTKSDVQIYAALDYRHWDTWEDGRFSHIFLHKAGDTAATDLMPGDPYDCPQQPFGGGEDYLFNNEGTHVLYVTKKKTGTAYAISTNTDIYDYDIATHTTKDLTEDNPGYDISPAYNAKGELAWLSQARDGYEADKQDLKVSNGKVTLNLTASRDDINVESFKWSTNGRDIYFVAPKEGTLRLFKVNYPGVSKVAPVVTQITDGNFDVTGIVAQKGDQLFITRTDFNHAAEVFSLNTTNGNMQQLTHVNDSLYQTIAMCSFQKKYVTTTDHKQMLVWVIFPPNFDSTKKYPALLYCQGGPQTALTQFYSFRWNFQLIAGAGYVIIAPDRRGMAGFGTAWNEAVSKDWGGQVLQDYLSAIDAVSREPYVDTARRGCVGASFGGYSVYALAGIHNHRFKTFIAHDGIFDFRSMYSTTDELWFENWEKGGAYWDVHNAVAQRSFSQSPSNYVQNWDAPILIVQGGHDYRVPAEQGEGAFQAAQLRGIKSRFLFFPNENHWVLKPQDALIWQHEFFNWLSETMP